MRRLVAAVSAALALVGPGAALAAGQELEVGELRLVSEGGEAIEEGGSGTPFTLDLPDGASCPGDSADDGYRVNSYMVPIAVDPRDVVYDGLGVSPRRHGDYDTFQQPLYEVTSAYYVSALTEDVEEAGAPALILEPPMLDFAVYSRGDLPAGRYHLGLACTLLNEIERLWDAQVEVVEDPSDEPAGIRWRVIGFVPDEAESSPAVPIAAAAVASIALAAALIVRRRSSA